MTKLITFYITIDMIKRIKYMYLVVFICQYFPRNTRISHCPGKYEYSPLFCQPFFWRINLFFSKTYVYIIFCKLHKSDAEDY